MAQLSPAIEPGMNGSPTYRHRIKRLGPAKAPRFTSTMFMALGNSESPVQAARPAMRLLKPGSMTSL